MTINPKIAAAGFNSIRITPYRPRTWLLGRITGLTGLIATLHVTPQSPLRSHSSTIMVLRHGSPWPTRSLPHLPLDFMTILMPSIGKPCSINHPNPLT